MIDPSVSILVAVILVFVAYYLHESHQKTKLQNENTKVINENTELKNKITELETKDAKSQEIILDQQKQITILSHDIPPASASSEPKPDDYHAKRKIGGSGVIHTTDPDLQKCNPKLTSGGT